MATEKMEPDEKLLQPTHHLARDTIKQLYYVLIKAFQANYI